MAADARFNREDLRYLTTAANTSDGELWQGPNGRALVQAAGVAKSSGTNVGFYDPNAIEFANVPKSTSYVFVDGDEVYWDHSANLAVPFDLGDRDYYLGTAVGDYAAADPAMLVAFGVRPSYKIDFSYRGFDSQINGTLGGTDGFGYPVNLGGSLQMELTATNEAQRVDALSVIPFSVSSNPVIDFAWRVISDGSGTTPDFNIGVANGTNQTNFDSITEYLAFHMDGNALDIYAQSNLVAATDTTINYSEGRLIANRVHGKLDMRDLTACKLYINGARVLSATTFDMSAATGPLFAIAHLEKTSSTDTYKAVLDYMRVRTSEQ